MLCMDCESEIKMYYYYTELEGVRASTGLSLLCVDVGLGYKQWSNDRPIWGIMRLNESN